MSSIIISPTGAVPVKFHGTKTDNWSSQFIRGRDQNRFYEVELYSIDTDDKEFLTIAYRTLWQGEHDHLEYHIIDSEESIATALQAYNPLAHLIGFPGGAAFKDKQTALQRSLLDQWNQIKAEIYNDLEITEPLQLQSEKLKTSGSIPFDLYREIAEESKKRGILASELLGEVLLPFYLHKERNSAQNVTKATESEDVSR